MMDIKKALKKVSAVSFAALVGVIVLFTGCGEQESEKEGPKPWEPESYMKDEAFTGHLKEKMAERKQLMKKYVEAKAEFDKASSADPKMEKAETKALKEKLDAIAREYGDNRKETLKKVRERLTPKTGKSKPGKKEGAK